MAEVKLTVPMAGPRGAWGIGDRYECSADEAKRMIEAGMAVAIAEPKVERAVKTPVVEKRDGDNSKRAKARK